MMRKMRDLNHDCVSVGWYQTASFDAFCNAATVQIQYTHQIEIRNSVMLVHDPHRTTEGYLALRAFRLTDRFLEFYQKGQFSQLQYVIVRRVCVLTCYFHKLCCECALVVAAFSKQKQKYITQNI